MPRNAPSAAAPPGHSHSPDHDGDRDAAPRPAQALPRVGYRGQAGAPLRARHLLLRVQDADAARRVLRGLPTSHGHGEGPLPEAGLVDVGLTHSGLLKLAGAQRDEASTVAALGVAWRDGAARRAARLGDSGPSAAAHWPDAFQPDATDVVLHLHAVSVEALDRLERRVTAHGLAPAAWAPLDATRRLDAGGVTLPARPWNARVSEPFGFRDGIMTPGLGRGASPRLDRPGDLLLGHVNGVDTNIWDLRRHRPEDAPGQDGNRAAHRDYDERAARRSDWLRDGCFGALRWMEQRVGVFEAWVADAAAQLAQHPHFRAWWAQAGAGDGAAATEVCDVFIRSRLVGRWPNGVPLRPGQGYRQPAPPVDRRDASLVDFDFRDDPRGRACPFGSHIRRMNPRGPEVVPARARPLVRRGLAWQDGARSGLMGLFFCASLEDQFEHLLAEWAQKPTMGPDHAGRAQDPLVGAHDDPDAALEVWLPQLPDQPDAEQPLRLRFDRGPFVLTRGTLYAFYPARAAFDQLCGAGHGQ